ncbi:MAG TPA: FG-GAP repeat protein, partial [Phycisphaerae bacterium]|nr:FG-GAP repeat protein [Phycisphaerae bacterium]
MAFALLAPGEAFAANTQASAAFGSPVAIDGEYAVVGVPSEDSPSSNAGAAYVYRYDGSGWEISGYLLPQ